MAVKGAEGWKRANHGSLPGCSVNLAAVTMQLLGITFLKMHRNDPCLRGADVKQVAERSVFEWEMQSALGDREFRGGQS